MFNLSNFVWAQQGRFLPFGNLQEPLSVCVHPFLRSTVHLHRNPNFPQYKKVVHKNQGSFFWERTLILHQSAADYKEPTRKSFFPEFEEHL